MVRVNRRILRSRSCTCQVEIIACRASRPGRRTDYESELVRVPFTLVEKAAANTSSPKRPAILRTRVRYFPVSHPVDEVEDTFENLSGFSTASTIFTIDACAFAVTATRRYALTCQSESARVPDPRSCDRFHSQAPPDPRTFGS